MRITFVLPGFIDAPMGGVKVVVEYANRLVQRGHRVTLIYPLTIGSRCLRLAKKLSSLLNGKALELYYQPDPRVNVLVVQRIIAKYIPLGDAIIAVGWQTAAAVADLPSEGGKKFYFLQSFEIYFRQKQQVLASYRLPMQKIAIAQWIIDELHRMDENALGPLGSAVNPQEFFLENSNAPRPNDVIMFYHHRRIKGAKEGLAVLQQLKQKRPETRAIIVSPRPPLHRIPEWCELVIQPEIAHLRQLYNSTKVLLFPSKWEGWGLPPMEALACGCAVVAAANRGVCEYLTDNENALLCPLGDRQLLFTKLLQLLEDEPLREKLVASGRETVLQYSWDNLITAFEAMLQ